MIGLQGGERLFVPSNSPPIRRRSTGRLSSRADHTPAVQVFAILSFSFGGPEAGHAEKPASAH